MTHNRFRSELSELYRRHPIASAEYESEFKALTEELVHQRWLLSQVAKQRDVFANRSLQQYAELSRCRAVSGVSHDDWYALCNERDALAARLQKIMARCADLLDEDQFNELDAIAGAAVQPEGCCVDYPRCDCNSPPEPDNAPDVQPCGHPWKAQHDFKCILCSSPGVAP